MKGDSAPSTTSTAVLMRMLSGYRVTQMLYVVAKLGIANLLADGAKTADQLAAATSANPDALYRTLRALASISVFEEIAPRRFALTPLATLLQIDHPNSMHARAIFWGEEPYQAWGGLHYSVMTGEPAFDHIFGTSHFSYLANHAESSAIFNQVMSSAVRLAADAIADAYDFSTAHTLVDIGGGQGVLLSTILRANPALHGILFDQPHVVVNAEPMVATAGVADRCALVGGDFFTSALPHGDIYTLRQIIHDWDDEQCVAILKNCAQSLAAGGKVLVIENVIEQSATASETLFLDIMMLVMTGGHERTADEFRSLFSAAGLQVTRIIPTGAPACIIEGEQAI
ncbi:MAG: methyltransferase [Ktedonobacterales bacterium]